MNDKDAKAPVMVTIDSDELDRLHTIEELFWEIECSLPSGLESWIEDDKLAELRG